MELPAGKSPAAARRTGVIRRAAAQRVAHRSLAIDRVANTVSFAVDGFSSYGAGVLGACESETDCEPELLCVEGVCEAAGCHADEDCEAFETCADGACALAPGRCRGSGDCATDEACSDGVCALAAGRCRVDLDCASDELCGDGQCGLAPWRCRVDGDCDSIEVCQVSGTCKLAAGQCRFAGDCLYGQTCVNNACTGTPAQCANNAECPFGQLCSSQQCLPAAGACRIVSDCPGDEACMNSLCVASNCLTDSCAGGTTCREGSCECTERSSFGALWSAAGRKLATFCGATIPLGATLRVMSNGKVLALGSSSSSVFDPSTDLWTAADVATLPVGTGVYGRLLTGAILGQTFNPATGTWSGVASPAVTHGGGTATLLANGQVLLAGGVAGSSIMDDVTTATAELFDPATNSWSATGSMTKKRRRHTAVLLASGKVLVVGGLAGPDMNPSPVRGAELYDPALGTWSDAGDPGSARISASLTALPDGHVLLAGGADGVSGDSGIHGLLATASLFVPATRTWQPAGTMSTGHRDHFGLVTPAGKLLVIGGLTLGGLGVRAWEQYDPVAGQWGAPAQLPEYRLHGATLLPDGRVLTLTSW